MAAKKKKPKKIHRELKSYTCEYCDSVFEAKISTKRYCDSNCKAKALAKEMNYKPKVHTGRPTKYKKEFCQKLIKHMAEGLSFEAFAGEVGVSLDTIYNWAKEHPEFSEAKKTGTSKCRAFWEKMGRNGAGGKLKGFQGGTWIFNMKNRFSWVDKQEVTVEGDFTPWSQIKTNEDE